MKAIILAAGFGSRLGWLTKRVPKPLLIVGGMPLLHYPIQAMLSAGVAEIAVVVGHRAAQVTEYLADSYPSVSVVQNHRFEGGNALSILSAEAFVGDEPFLVSMADHMMGKDIVGRLIADDEEACTLCVDWQARLPSQINDATRVLVDDRGFIQRIGKEIARWNAIDTGVFRMTPNVFDVIDHLSVSQGVDVSITDMVQTMGEHAQTFATTDVSGMFWADIDTIEDYRSVDGLSRETDGFSIRRVGFQAP